MQTSLSAFEELYHTHGERMKSVAYNLLGSRSDAEDAVQEAFLKACRSRERFGGRAALSTWIYRILINTCYDLGRRRTSHRDDRTDELSTVPPPTVAPGDHPLRITLERIVEGLSPRLREVFLLYEVEGLTHREIGEALQIAEGTSKAALFEAKRQVRAALRRDPPPAEKRGSP